VERKEPLRHARHSVIITSTVSNEAVLRGLPVVSTGRGWWNGSGIFEEADGWAGLAATPAVNVPARSKWLNWWFRRQAPLLAMTERFAQVCDEGRGRDGH
jgi:hypothetical protein